jgi:hypothetical protein
METVHGANLGLKLRKLSDTAKHRVWIVSPYIGRWPAVKALLGPNWWLSSTVLLRVITDVDDPAFVNRGTLLKFLNRGPVATLRGVHAKIYIVDDRAIVTSANLTETAFTKRREVGVLLDVAEAKDTIAIVGSWWEAHAKEISPEDVQDWEKTSPLQKEREGEAMPTLFSLPETPSDSLFSVSDAKTRDFAGYRKFLECYRDLAGQYSKLQRLWPDGSLFIETDSFLNYLFHEAEGTPSFEYYDKAEPRTLTKEKKAEKIEKWAPKFAEWIGDSHDEDYRFKRSKLIQRLLAKDTVDDLSREDVRDVADCLHCMQSQRLIRHKFLNPANNELDAIRMAWETLLHGHGTLEQRMQECNDSLRFFGTSSVQELLGWYYPNEYPIRNSNTDAGLRFFGYAV